MCRSPQNRTQGSCELDEVRVRAGVCHLYQVADDEVGAGRHPEAVPVHDLRRHPAAVQPGADRPPALDTDTADCRQ